MSGIGSPAPIRTTSSARSSTASCPTCRAPPGRLGTGSDVLGLDDETSRDHDWDCG